MTLLPSIRVPISLLLARLVRKPPILNSHDEQRNRREADNPSDHHHDDNGEPLGHAHEARPAIPLSNVGSHVDSSQTDLHRVQNHSGDGENGNNRGHEMLKKRPPLGIDVEVGQVQAKQKRRAVDARQPQLAIVKTSRALLVLDVLEGADKVAVLLVAGQLAVRLLGDQPDLARKQVVGLVLDEEIVAAHEAEGGLEDVRVRILDVRPEGGRVEVGGDGLDEDALVVPHQVQAWMLVYDDLALAGFLVVQRGDVSEGGSLDKDVAHEGEEGVDLLGEVDFFEVFLEILDGFDVVFDSDAGLTGEELLGGIDCSQDPP